MRRHGALHALALLLAVCATVARADYCSLTWDGLRHDCWHTDYTQACQSECASMGPTEDYCAYGCQSYYRAMSSLSYCHESCDTYCADRECTTDELDACREGCLLMDRQVYCCTGGCNINCTANGVCGLGRDHQYCWCMSVVGQPQQWYSGPYCLTVPGSEPTMSSVPATSYLASDSPSPSLRFGEMIAASGNLLVVGTKAATVDMLEHAGVASVYTCTTGTVEGCSLFAELKKPGTRSEYDRFGNKLAVSGSLVVVGGLRFAYVFDCSTAASCADGYELDSLETVLDTYGDAVAVHGTFVFVGKPMGFGSVFVFHCPSAAACALFETLTINNGSSGANFGASIAMSGSLLAVGAPGYASGSGGTTSGAVFIFHCTAGQHCVQGAMLSAPSQSSAFGFAVAIDGELLVVGAPNSDAEIGRAHVYRCRSSASCAQVAVLGIGLGAKRFGGSVAIKDGLVAIGASDTFITSNVRGAAYTYSCSWAAGCAPLFRLAQTEQIFTSVGLSVAVGGSAPSSTFVAVGAPGITLDQTTQAGAIYMERTCPGGRFGNDCSGVCGHCATNCTEGLTGTGCPVCAPGWTGPSCDECLSGRHLVHGECICQPGHYGANCLPCPSECSGYCSDGMAGNGTCYCRDNTPGPDCVLLDACPRGHFGADCTPCESCNGHGSCNDGEAGDGQCSCDAGYDPAQRCNACVAPYFDPDEGDGVLTCVLPDNCPEDTWENAQWPATPRGEFAHGTCMSGYAGQPQRFCQYDAMWENFVLGDKPCEIAKCPASTVNGISFPETGANQNATGQCPSMTRGSPVRTCLSTGTWSSNIIGQCELIVCLAETVDGMDFPETQAIHTVTVQCAPGNSGWATRYCDAEGQWQAVNATGCSQLKCLDMMIENALYPVTNALQHAMGECDVGFEGAPMRFCEASGTWATEVGGTPCVAITSCKSSSAGFADFPETDLNQLATGTCHPGYTGSPQRFCQENGEWDAVVNPCTPALCEPEFLNDALFPHTPLLENATGICDYRMDGAPVRQCRADGTWSQVVGGTPCVKKQCPPISDQNAHFNATDVEEMARGECAEGYAGTPFRYCKDDATWYEEITYPCTPSPCPAETIDLMIWPTATRNSLATGTCASGYGGVIKRPCNADGTWGNSTGTCTRLRCPAVTQFNVTWPASDSMMMVNGSCVAGFMSASTPQRECQRNGQWTSWHNNPCVPTIQCVNPVTLVWPAGGIQAPAGQAVTIAPDIRYASCFHPNGTVKISYTLNPEVPSLAALLSLGGTFIKIPAGRLPPGTYTLKATLTIDNVSLTSSTTLTVHALPPEIVLENAATWRYVGADVHNVLINATASRNPNPGGDPPTCLIMCFSFQGACPWNGFTTCYMEAEPNTLFPHTDLILTLTVSAVTNGQTTSSTTTVHIQVLPSLTAQVFISDPAPIPGGVVSASETIRLRASVWFYGDPEPTSLQWSSVPVEGHNTLALNNATLIGGTTGLALVIRGGVLQPGKYTFGFNVTSTSGESYAEFVLKVSAPPVAGTLAVSPTEGESLVTPFLLTVMGASDPDGESLSYQFMYEPAGGAPVALFAVRNPLSEVSLSSLPPGNYSVYCNVYDESGGVSSTNAIDIVVRSPSMTATEAVDTVLATALGQQDPSVILQVINVIAGQLAPSDGDNSTTSALLGAMQAAHTLLGTDEDSVPALLTTLNTMAPVMDEAVHEYALSMLESAARHASKAPVAFVEAASSLVAFRAARNETLSPEESASLQSSLDGLLFGMLEKVSCDEPPTVVQGSGLGVMAAWQSSYAGQSSDLPGVNVRFGAGFGGNNGPVLDESACQQLHQIAQSVDPYASSGETSYSALASVLSVSLYTPNEDPIPVHSLSADESFTFRFDVSLGDIDPSNVSCIYWNTTLLDWDSSGCEVTEATATYVECKCNHLTTFTVGMARVTLNVVDPADPVERFPTLPKTHAGVVSITTVAVIGFVFLVALALSMWGDRKDRTMQLVPSLEQIGAFINRYAELYGRPVDATVVETVQLRELHRMYELHRYEDGGDRGATTTPSRWDAARVHIGVALRTQHAWLALFFRPVTLFTRVDRLAVTFSIVCGSLVTNALFYQFGNDPIDPAALIAQRALTAVLSSLIVIVPVGIIQFLLRRTRRMSPPEGVREVAQFANDDKLPTKMGLKKEAYLRRRARWQTLLLDWKLPWWMSIVLYIILAAGAALCLYVTLLYGVTFTDIQANMWIESFLISIALSVLVWQPLTAIGGVLLSACLGGTVAASAGTAALVLDTFAA